MAAKRALSICTDRSLEAPTVGTCDVECFIFSPRIKEASRKLSKVMAVYLCLEISTLPPNAWPGDRSMVATGRKNGRNQAGIINMVNEMVYVATLFSSRILNCFLPHADTALETGKAVTRRAGKTHHLFMGTFFPEWYTGEPAPKSNSIKAKNSPFVAFPTGDACQAQIAAI